MQPPDKLVCTKDNPVQKHLAHLYEHSDVKLMFESNHGLRTTYQHFECPNCGLTYKVKVI
jgi:hypothetical protein